MFQRYQILRILWLGPKSIECKNEKSLPTLAPNRKFYCYLISFESYNIAFKYIITIMDAFSTYADFKILKDKKSDLVARKLLGLLAKFNCLNSIIFTYNGSSYIYSNNIAIGLAEKLGDSLIFFLHSMLNRIE